MRGRTGIWIVGVVVAVCGAAVGVHASSASPPRHVGVGAGITNATYSCAVGQEHSVNVYGSVTLPPQDGRKQPGLLVVTTGAKTTVKNGVTTTVSQLGLAARKNSLKVDNSSCTRVKHQISLKPKGLPKPATIATKNLFGHISVTCTTSRVTARLLLKTKAGIPTRALLAVRSASNRPLAFYDWTPGKVIAYSAGSCTQTQ